MEDGEVAVEADCDEQEGAQVEAEGAKEHQDAASCLSPMPGHRDRPYKLRQCITRYVIDLFIE